MILVGLDVSKLINKCQQLNQGTDTQHYIEHTEGSRMGAHVQLMGAHVQLMTQWGIQKPMHECMNRCDNPGTCTIRFTNKYNNKGNDKSNTTIGIYQWISLYILKKSTEVQEPIKISSHDRVPPPLSYNAVAIANTYTTHNK